MGQIVTLISRLVNFANRVCFSWQDSRKPRYHDSGRTSRSWLLISRTYAYAKLIRIAVTRIDWPHRRYKQFFFPFLFVFVMQNICALWTSLDRLTSNKLHDDIIATSCTHVCEIFYASSDVRHVCGLFFTDLLYSILTNNLWTPKVFEKI